MKGKRLLSFMLAALLLSALWPAARAAEPETEEVLRVGFFAFSGYHTIAEDGRRSGYGYDFLQRLALHAGWKYEYIGYDLSHDECLDLLRDGEVDVVTSVSKTPGLERDFLFSDRNIGTNPAILTVKAGNQRIMEDEYDTYDGITVGMLEDNPKNADFERFAARHGFSFEPVYFTGQEELSAALQREEIDAALTGSFRVLENEWLLESFSAKPFYICCRKDRPELMERINKAIEEMDKQNPDWRDTLHETYYSTDRSGSVVMSAEERTFLEEFQASGRTLRLLFNPELAPYCYFKDGRARGILPAIFEELAQRLGLKYEFIPVANRDEYYEKRAAGEADVVLDFAEDYYLAEEEDYKITDAYFPTYFSRLTRNGFSGTVERLAMVKRADAVSSYISDRYPNVELVMGNSVDDCARAVAEGRADAVVMYAYMAEQYVRDDARNRLSSAVLGGTGFSYGVANQVPNGRYLLSLLDKGIDSFDETQLDTIAAREIEESGTVDMSLTAFIYRNPAYGILGTALALLLLFVLAMLVARTRNQKRLKKKVAQATSDLEAKTEELSQALQAADAANRAKTTFLNNMSHDIRTPMNAIIGYTTLTTTHLDNKERARDYLAKIAQASNHLLSLINDVLDMSRIESGKVTIEERPENLADILQGLRNIIQSDIHAKQLELFIDTVDVTDEEIFCDRLRLNQILLNLTSNAIKFTPAGGTVAIRVTQRPAKSKDRGIYEFRVSDTGIGMSQEFIKTVFEPFTRERTSTVSGIQGTGLGMAITKNIVDMMGGSIQVESEPGKGSTFTVELELRFTAEHREMGPIVELTGLRGLVVDDDLVSCQSVSKMLRQIGMRAEWTLSGKEAVVRTSEAIELADPFEVYIVDWSMPEMSGVETVRQIRRIVGDDSPIILMSAYDWSDIEEDALQAGVTGFISKPLFASDLHNVLEKSLGRAEGEPAPDSGPAEDCFVGKRILLTEDNELNREIAAELLGEAGFLVECAENGQMACDMVRQSPPGHYDLILMDIQMPIMDGYAATRAIRAMEDKEQANIPIIAMTANAFEEDREKAIDAGMNGYLAKPVDVNEMMKLLRGIFQPEN